MKKTLIIIFITCLTCFSFIAYSQGKKGQYGTGGAYVTPVAPQKVYKTTNSYTPPSSNYNNSSPSYKSSSPSSSSPSSYRSKLKKTSRPALEKIKEEDKPLKTISISYWGPETATGASYVTTSGYVVNDTIWCVKSIEDVTDPNYKTDPNIAAHFYCSYVRFSYPQIKKVKIIKAGVTVGEYYWK